MGYWIELNTYQQAPDLKAARTVKRQDLTQFLDPTPNAQWSTTTRLAAIATGTGRTPLASSVKGFSWASVKFGYWIECDVYLNVQGFESAEPIKEQGKSGYYRLVD